ncbi:unnamed protein product [Gongylonema pulchrum]|uniref:40S ribosomal protein S6 n=1 Tax=Gongylonema pulchrum TaxID=637853 RepID=A0A183DJ80_9BILA|nr:unnamed protein product [Gongylonema pulchrum]
MTSFPGVLEPAKVLVDVNKAPGVRSLKTIFEHGADTTKKIDRQERISLYDADELNGKCEVYFITSFTKVCL